MSEFKLKLRPLTVFEQQNLIGVTDPAIWAIYGPRALKTVFKYRQALAEIIDGEDTPGDIGGAYAAGVARDAIV